VTSKKQAVVLSGSLPVDFGDMRTTAAWHTLQRLWFLVSWLEQAAHNHRASASYGNRHARHNSFLLGCAGSFVEADEVDDWEGRMRPFALVPVYHRLMWMHA